MKIDLQTSKLTYMYQKNPTHIKRGPEKKTDEEIYWVWVEV